MDANAELEVRDAADAGRYELLRGGEVIGYAAYRVQDGRAIVPHVEVDPSVEGQGLGGREEVVRERDGGLHARSIRAVIPPG